jgi:hypothetical protein
VLEGYPFPEIYIAAGSVDLETGEGTELLVDGQQRLSTLYQYFKGSPELKLPSTVPPYADLDKDAKSRFLEYDVVVRYIGPVSINEIREIFERINATSYSLNAMEIHNARYAGEFKRFGEWYANRPFFEEHRVFSANEMRRMDDVRFALTITITIMSTYFNRDEPLEKFLRNYNDSFPEKHQIAQDMEQVTQFVDQCDFDPRSSVWKRSNLFSLIVEVHRALIKDQLDLDPSSVKSRVSGFFADVDRVSSSDNESMTPSVLRNYYKASLQATNDRGSRILRGQMLGRVLRGQPIDADSNQTGEPKE